DFYLEQKRWGEAATAYATAAQRDPANPLPLYLRGVALVRAGKEKDGKVLIERARLAPLTDEVVRYKLAGELAARDLRDEANAERGVIVRRSAVGPLYAVNVSANLAFRAYRERKDDLEAARYYRKVYLGMALGNATFLDPRGYLNVPAWAHLYQTRGLMK